MPIPVRPQTASVDPRFHIVRTDDGSHTLLEIATGETFHSGCGAAAECRHVYLENSGIAERLGQGRAASTLEVGFGTGMAFALTAAEAIRCRTPLRYVALERRPLAAPLIEQVLRVDRDSPLAEARLGHSGATEPLSTDREYGRVCRSLVEHLSALPAVSRGVHDVRIAANCHLQLVIGDLSDWQPAPEERFAAIYFDPFSPATNPQLWEVGVLRRMHAVLAPGGRLVSYCVSRAVRDSLEAAGFHVRRVAGPPGGKRQVLIAERH